MKKCKGKPGDRKSLNELRVQIFLSAGTARDNQWAIRVQAAAPRFPYRQRQECASPASD